jgi:hypothetical protein
LSKNYVIDVLAFINYSIAFFTFYVANSEYFYTPLQDAHEIIRESAVDRKRFLSEHFDCDDWEPLILIYHRIILGCDPLQLSQNEKFF